MYQIGIKIFKWTISRGFCVLFLSTLIALQPSGLLYDTLIPLAFSHCVKAQDVVIGQRLISLNNRLVEVVASQEKLVQHMVCIQLINGETIFTALEQQFFCLHDERAQSCRGCCWSSAMNLYSGVSLRALGVPSGWIEVESMEVLNIREGECSMFQLTTEPDHVFCITNSLVVVHNCNDQAKLLTNFVSDDSI